MASTNEFTPKRMNASSGLTRLRPKSAGSSFLSLAHAWTHAALRREGVMIPIDRISNQEKTPPVGGAGGV
jgi:hypothetical protein